MGFFSYLCKSCEQPLLSPYSEFGSENGWMMYGVYISPASEVVCGVYDGYGRLDGYEFNPYATTPPGPEPCVYHYACYMAEGQPVVGALIEGVCGACHLKLSAAEEHEARQEDPPRCVHCRAILVP